MDIFANIDLWETAGPLIIAGVVAILIGLSCLFIMKQVENRLLKELISGLGVILLIGGVLGTAIYASGLWGSR